MKLNGVSSVVDVDVIDTKRVVENPSRSSVTEAALRAPVTPAGSPERLSS